MAVDLGLLSTSWTAFGRASTTSAHRLYTVGGGDDSSYLTQQCYPGAMLMHAHLEVTNICSRRSEGLMIQPWWALTL